MYSLSARCSVGSFATHVQARSQPSDNGEWSFSSDFGPLSGFENWSSQWLSRGKSRFYRASV